MKVKEVVLQIASLRQSSLDAERQHNVTSWLSVKNHREGVGGTGFRPQLVDPPDSATVKPGNVVVGCGRGHGLVG
ncbi:MAG: hypothetical protein ACJZ2F_02070 [Acidimicrobiales bacterium]